LYCKYLGPLAVSKGLSHQARLFRQPAVVFWGHALWNNAVYVRRWQQRLRDYFVYVHCFRSTVTRYFLE